MKLSEWHFGRSWVGHAIEDECPCPQAPCGLVIGDAVEGCNQHDPAHMRTIRQSHPADKCPAREDDE